eukprot:SAG31_NODE_2843_length_5012_cov_2.267454_6_plen_71_part_00
MSRKAKGHSQSEPTLNVVAPTNTQLAIQYMASIIYITYLHKVQGRVARVLATFSFSVPRASGTGEMPTSK